MMEILPLVSLLIGLVPVPSIPGAAHDLSFIDPTNATAFAASRAQSGCTRSALVMAASPAVFCCMLCDAFCLQQISTCFFRHCCHAVPILA